MGKGSASITMNYEINLLGLRTKLTGKEHLSFPMIQDAPIVVEIPKPEQAELSEEEVKEKKKPWWKRAIDAGKKIAVTMVKVVAASAAVVAVATVGALALAAVPIAVGATTVGAVLSSVAATTALSWGAAALGATAVGVYDVVTGEENSQEIYDIAANASMMAANITLTVGAIKDLVGALSGPMSGPPGLSFAGEGVVAGGVIGVDGTGVIEAGMAGAFGVVGGNALFSLGKGGSGSKKATEYETIKKGTKEWEEAVKEIKQGGNTNYRVESANDAKDLLKEARGDMNRYKQYTSSFKKGFEMHPNEGNSINAPQNNLRHLKWKDWHSKTNPGKGHIFYNK